jgi:hypothetical protein
MVKSVTATISSYKASLARLRRGSALDLQNRDFDTGRPTRAGEYRLADDAYASLLSKLAARDFENVTPELRDNILTFYSNLNAPLATKTDRSEWRDAIRALARLKTHKPRSARAHQPRE